MTRKLVIRCCDCNTELDATSDEEITDHLEQYHGKPEFEIRWKDTCKYCGKENSES